jgi:hypothetical protein
MVFGARLPLAPASGMRTVRVMSIATRRIAGEQTLRRRPWYSPGSKYPQKAVPYDFVAPETKYRDK